MDHGDLLFRSEAPGPVFSASYLRESFTPHIPLDKIGAAVFPADKSRKGQRPPASYYRKGPHAPCLGCCDIFTAGYKSRLS
jgi:hypothetical protein